MSVRAAFNICSKHPLDKSVSTIVKTALIAAGMSKGRACVSPSRSDVMSVAAPKMNCSRLSGDVRAPTSVEIISKAPSIRSGALSTIPLTRAMTSSIASGMITGIRIATLFTRLSNSEVKPSIKASLLSAMLVAICSMTVPTIEINCGAIDITTGRRADITLSTTFNIWGMYFSTSATALGANDSMILAIWSMSPPVSDKAPEKSPIRLTRSPLASVSKGKRT